MKIAYIGDFINHGDILSTSGTPIVFLLARLKEVDEVAVFCPYKNGKTEQIDIPEKIKVTETYRYGNFRSVIGILGLDFRQFDRVIFNLLPGAFGKSALSNTIGLILPIIFSKFCGIKGVEVIYHNSAYTTDLNGIGWNTSTDKLKILVLRYIEKLLFRNVKTFVLLKIYQERIKKKIPDSKVFFLDGRYLEAITTVIQNGLLESEFFVSQQTNNLPSVLLHGSWNPQKNLGIALKALSNLRNRGVKFSLTISGSLNANFPNYKIEFETLMKQYSTIIDRYLGRVDEKDMFALFSSSDLIILPYNSPGGHSGVIETGNFFENRIIAIDFPEFEEQSAGSKLISLVKEEDIESAIGTVLSMKFENRTISVKKKVEETLSNIKALI